MHDHQRECRFTLRLPVAMAKDLDVRLNLEQPLFGLGEPVLAIQEIACERLQVSAAQPASWHKRVRFDGTGVHL
jgi:hypothetical protein